MSLTKKVKHKIGSLALLFQGNSSYKTLFDVCWFLRNNSPAQGLTGHVRDIYSVMSPKKTFPLTETGCVPDKE